jgi:antitoxin CptB
MSDYSHDSSKSMAEQKKALLWQCRRGIKEIEVLLIPFLEKHFENETEEIQKAFIVLLEESDLDMFEWFTHRDKPEDPQMELVVNVILERLAPET